MDQSFQQFSNEAKQNGLVPNEISPFYGRYRLRGDQAFPNFKSSFDIYLRILESRKLEMKQAKYWLKQLSKKVHED